MLVAFFLPIHLQSTAQLYTSNSNYVSYSNIEQVLLNTAQSALEEAGPDRISLFIHLLLLSLDSLHHTQLSSAPLKTLLRSLQHSTKKELWLVITGDMGRTTVS